MYSGLKLPHSVNGVEADGQLLVLEDGSRWQVYEGFAFRTQAWSNGDMINVKQNKNSDYPYLLVNIHRNEQVEAQYLQEDRQ